jgi:hypothetical protein
MFQSGRSKQRGGRRHNPHAFTEQGVAMLSSVLRSERAVQVNVAIMRAFVSLRRMLAGNKALARKLAELEHRLEGHDASIRSLFEAIRQLRAPPSAPPRPEIGFHVKEDAVPYRTRKRARPHSPIGNLQLAIGNPAPLLHSSFWAQYDRKKAR